MKIFLLVALLFSLTFATSVLHCGVVNDGNNGDIDVQASTSKLSASWSGFEDGSERNRILRYEWCVISSVFASNSINERGCRVNSGFIGQPDVMGWTNAERTTSVSANLRLKNGETYYIVVRATTALGFQKYTNSDGVTIDINYVEHQTRKVTPRNTIEERDQVTNVVSSSIPCDNSDCEINQNWKCNAAQVSVREYLEEFYGPAQFLVDNSAITIFRLPIVAPGPVIKHHHHDDDDDDLSTGDVIGIAIGITAFFCILALIAIVLSTFTGSGGKFDTTVRRNENVEEF